jgi:tetratricopeptide (TPR) repeat protein
MKRFSFQPILIVAVSLLFLISCGKFQAKIDMKQGNDLYSAKKYEEAIQKFQSAIQKSPDLAPAYLNVGLSYMALYVPGSTHPKDIKYADEAIRYLKEYLKRNPADTKANEYLVQMYLNADRKDDAIQYFAEYLQKNPNDVQIIQKLAYLYAQTGKFDEALKWYKQRTTVEPNNPEAYYVIGVICWEKSYKFADVTPEERQKLIDTGMQALEKAISINPDYADAYLYMNLLYREQAKMISPDPNLVPVPDDKIDEYNALLDKAKQYQEKALEIRKKANPT